MVLTQILEPLEFDASTATKEEIAANAALKETAKRIYTLIDTYDKSDTDLGSITIMGVELITKSEKSGGGEIIRTRWDRLKMFG